jgi:hypothetical protein
MSIRPFALVAPAALSLLVAWPAAAQTPPTYALTFLGPADSVSTLSETGVAVGQRTVGGNTRGWVASATSAMTLLPLAPGDASSWANDVNEQGVIVGALSTFLSPEFFPRAVAWLPDGLGGYTIKELGGLPGNIGSVATTIDIQGDILGYSKTGMFRLPVWFTSPGGLLDLNPFGIFDPQSINDQRVFVDVQGRRMDLNTMVVENLGLPVGPIHYQATSGYAINEYGQIAGTAVLATSTNCVYQATRYVDGPGWQMLSPCSGIANASDINDFGDVIFQWALTVRILHLEGIGDFLPQDLLSPSAKAWNVLASSSMDINSARQLAVMVQNDLTGVVGAALLTPIQTVQADLGFGGPGLSHLQVAGGTLAMGATAELTLTGVPAFGLAYLLAGLVDAPTPLKGGTLVPFPILITVPVAAGPAGTLIVPGIPGGNGPASLYVQSANPDASLQGGYGFSNAVRIDLLP